MTSIFGFLNGTVNVVGCLEVICFVCCTCGAIGIGISFLAGVGTAGFGFENVCLVCSCGAIGVGISFLAGVGTSFLIIGVGTDGGAGARIGLLESNTVEDCGPLASTFRALKQKIRIKQGEGLNQLGETFRCVEDGEGRTYEK